MFNFYIISAAFLKYNLYQNIKNNFLITYTKSNYNIILY